MMRLHDDVMGSENSFFCWLALFLLSFILISLVLGLLMIREIFSNCEPLCSYFWGTSI